MRFPAIPVRCLIVFAAVIGASACRKPAVQPVDMPPPSAALPAVDKTSLLRPQQIGAKAERPPWIAHVNAMDLDRDGLLDVLACDTLENKVVWLRQTSRGRFEEKVIGEDMRAPVRAELADIDQDGDPDVIVSSMGVVFPNNDPVGTLFVLENLGQGKFERRILLENVARITDARAADFNGDGRIDIALAQFGYDQGEVQWLEQTSPWTFAIHPLFSLSGAINLCVGDFAGDGSPDFAVQFSQQWEEIHVFENLGQGRFRRNRIWGSSNEDYGSSGMVAADVNGDKRLDLVFTNGDGFGPAVVPGPRPYHGVQWLENLGGGKFGYHRIGDAYGAYSPATLDLDADGKLDVAVVAAFIERDGQDHVVPSLLWFRNLGDGRWEKNILAREPQHQVTLSAGDFSGNGQVTLVTGGFYVFNAPLQTGRITLWRH